MGHHLNIDIKTHLPDPLCLFPACHTALTQPQTPLPTTVTWYRQHHRSPEDLTFHHKGHLEQPFPAQPQLPLLLVLCPITDGDCKCSSPHRMHR